MAFGGTFTFDIPTYRAVLLCLLKSIERHGFKRVFIVNGHGGNNTALNAFLPDFAVATGLDIRTATYFWLAPGPMKEILEDQESVRHACEAETSMMLALIPDLIDRDGLSQVHGPYVPGLAAIPGVNPGVYRWRQLSSRSLIGVIGDAGAATPEKGEKLLQAIASAVAKALLEERLWEEPI